ncbi:MAG TPA: extracellular solute-binding protein, partial [Ardenticatenaceae bacterium]|nr:extracellular solute-binding protein [Ardenticatenaceae bacterium]
MRRRHTLLSLLVLLSLLLAACGGGAASPTAPAAQAPAEEPAEQPAEQATEAPAEQPAEEPAEQPTEAAEEPAEQPAGDGEAVSVLSLWGGSEQEAFQQVLDHCQESAGVTTQYEQARDFVPVLTSRVAGGNPPDVAIVPRPGVMVDLAEQGAIVPLADLGLGDDVMQENYGQAWIDLGTVEGALYGIVVKANSKSTIWYKPSSFEEQGFEIPETYDALVELSQAYVDAGQTPWAIGGKDTWTLTDWFENIYVRTAGPEMYSQLFGGELPFTDESVVTAMQEMARIVGNPEFIAGGVEGALGTGFVDGIGRVFGENPDAELYFEGGFVGGIALGEVNPDLKVGETIDFVPFPKVNDDYADAILGAGDL